MVYRTFAMASMTAMLIVISPSLAEAQSDALNQAIEYANKQLDWYDRFGFLKMLLFRISGVIAILSTVAITFLSASLEDSQSTVWRWRKKNVIAALAALSAVSVSLASFFGWQNSWETHRVAQLQIEALLTEAKINQKTYHWNGNEEALVREAIALTHSVRDIVLAETDQFYRGLDKEGNNNMNAASQKSGCVGDNGNPD